MTLQEHDELLAACKSACALLVKGYEHGALMVLKDAISKAEKIPPDYEPEQKYGTHYDIREHLRHGGTMDDY